MRVSKLIVSTLFAATVGLVAATSSATAVAGPASTVGGNPKDDEIPQCAKDYDKCSSPCVDVMSTCYGKCMGGANRAVIHACIERCDKAKEKCTKDRRCTPC